MRACFVSASGQNVFFEELLDALRSEVQAAGIDVETAIDQVPPPSDDLVYVLVPHEYIPLTLPQAHPSEAQLRRSVVIGTEQPGTQWFEETAHVAASAGATVDINPLGVAELRRRGVEARHLPLGYVPEWDYWHRADTPRPVDATFLGGHTPRRAASLARCAPVLADRRAALHLVETWRPHTAADRKFLSHERKFRHLASTKVLLNTHRAEYAYFEWSRLLAAAVNGSVVVTEHSSAFDPLVPGEHFVSVHIDHLPVALDALLDDHDRLRAIREAAYDFLRAELPLGSGVRTLLDALDDVGSRPLAGSRSHAIPRPAPKEPPQPPPAWQHEVADGADARLLRAGLKKVMLQQRRIERRLARLEHGNVDDAAVTTFGPHGRVEPKVSVVVTLYDYESVIADAIASVALSRSVELELVVVDDASTDGSVEQVRAALGRFGWLGGKLVQRAHNGGLPAARNLGVAHARGDYIFILDADNLLYPHGLDRLQAVLDDDEEAAFAYGIVETFDRGGPNGLVSWLPWDPPRFRYGNYIDAMAMVRRSALERVGGFTTDERLFGWEDFALWCSFAQLGLKGVHVPEIIGRYRSHEHSMLSLTNLDTSEAWAVLLDRFSFLSEVADNAGRGHD